jgi:hypothetical protein
MKQLQAFPAFEHHPDYMQMMAVGGMTLRDYFAAKALQGLLSDTTVRSTPEEFAANSYMVADAMMKARES